MSPEAGKFFGMTREALLEGLGATDNRIQEIVEEARAALEAGDYKASEQLIATLKRISALREKLLAAPDPFSPILEEFGLQNEDIPFVIQDETPAIEKPKDETPITTKTEEVLLKPEKYIDNAMAIAAQAFLAQRPDGSFVFNSPEEIAREILNEGWMDNPKALKDACFYVYSVAQSLAVKLPEFAKVARARRMKTLVYKALPEIRNPGWKFFYEEAERLYGKLSVDEFINLVILRLFPKKEKVKREVERERRKRKRMETKLIPSDLTPMDELMLCNKFMQDKALHKIQVEILEGENPEVIARKHGWQSELTIPTAFEKSREEMAATRDNRIPTDEEVRRATWIIERVIHRLRENRMGWHMIRKEYRAFRFLYSLMAEINGDQEKTDKLIAILFPIREYRADSQNSFFLEIGIKGKND